MNRNLIYTFIIQSGVIVLGLIFSGCESFNKVDIPLMAQAPTKYSETPQMLVSDKRKYKRMTKQQMEEESELQSQAGSLWMMEGQNSYLFAQNKSRREGDSLNIKLEGAGLKQVETKATTIKSLLKQLEDEKNNKGLETPAMADKGADGTDRKPAAAAAPAAPKADEKVDMSSAQVVQSKLVERLPDGNYRVKGTQPFMIDKKEFKVIVTGLLRPEDYKEDGVSSDKLLDPQFDVVTLRRNTENEENVY